MGVPDAESFEVHNSVNSPHVPEMVEILYKRLQRRGYLRRDCERMVNRDRNIFGSLLLKLGLGDAMITGVTRTYAQTRSDEHTSELQSLMRISYAVFCLKK